MIDSVKNLLKMDLPLYIIIDSQEWEAIIDYDIYINDIVEYEIKYNLNNEEYILINNILERGLQNV